MSRRNDPVLLRVHMSGPALLTVTESSVWIPRLPLPGHFVPDLIEVPRKQIRNATRERYSTTLGARLTSLFGLLTYVVIHTTDGRAYGVNGVPLWEASKLISLLSQPPA
jgi:hypothetical protein